MIFGIGSRANDVRNYIEVFVRTWSTARALNAVLDGKKEADKYTDYQKLLHYAAIYGAADSYAQLKRIKTADTAKGIELYFSKFSGGRDVYKDVLIAGTMPELAPMVQAAGAAVFEVIAKGADIASTFTRLYQTFLNLSGGSKK